MEDSTCKDLEVKRSDADDVLSQCDDFLISDPSSSSSLTDDRSSGPVNEIDFEQTRTVETGADESTSEDIEEMPKLIKTPEPEKSRKNGKFNLRKSLAWDSAFFTSDGVLDADELSTMIEGGEKAVKYQLPGIEEEVYKSMDSISTFESDNLSLDCLEAELFDDIRASIQKSNRSFNDNNSSLKVSSGKKDPQPKVNSCVLDADEPSTMIEGGEKGVKHHLPGIEEEVCKSMDSISTFESDNLSLDCLEAELFVDIRASIQKFNKSSNLNNSSIKGSSGKKDFQPKISSSLKKGDLDSGKRLVARTKDNTSSIPQSKIINRLNLNQNFNLALTKRASLSANHAKKDQDIAKKAHVTQKGTPTAKPTTLQGSKVTGVIGPRRAVPQPSVSSKSSSAASSATLKTEPTRPSSSSSSCSSGTDVKVNFLRKKADSKTAKLTAGSVTLKTPSRISMDNKPSSVSSNLSSSISPASSISDWSPESRGSSIDTSVSYRSFDGDTSVQLNLSNLPAPRISNQSGSLSRPPAVQPTGLRMPSPKIGFFDGGKTGVRTPTGATGGIRPQSRLPNVPTSSNGVKFGKIPPPKAAVTHVNMKSNPQKAVPKSSPEQPTSKPKTKSNTVTSAVSDHKSEANLNICINPSHNVGKDSNKRPNSRVNDSEVILNERFAVGKDDNKAVTDGSRIPFADKNSVSDASGTGMEVTEKTVNFPFLESQQNENSEVV